MTEQQPDPALVAKYADAIRPTMLVGLKDAVLYDRPGQERILDWVDWIAKTLADKDIAEVGRLAADARRALAALEDLIAYCDDPGSEALGARYCLAQTLSALKPGEEAPDVSGVSPEADSARILRIVGEHVAESNLERGKGLTPADLVVELEYAGYTVPVEAER
ncbi:hypothetical protein [Streptomyces virginiae]